MGGQRIRFDCYKEIPELKFYPPIIVHVDLNSVN